jgi:multiple sugar transport system permease protein
MTNSLIAVALNLAGMLLIYSLMANAITRFYWHGRGTLGVLGTIIVAGLFWILFPFVPGLRSLDFAPYPLWFGNWLVSGFSVIILCQSVRWIPRELEDSARLDGCGWFGIYRHIVLPLVGRELGLLAILTVMATLPVFWPPLITPSDFLPRWLYPMLWAANEESLSSIRSLLMMMAGSLVMTLPVMVVFFLSKRWFPRPAKLGNE